MILFFLIMHTEWLSQHGFMVHVLRKADPFAESVRMMYDGHRGPRKNAAAASLVSPSPRLRAIQRRSLRAELLEASGELGCKRKQGVFQAGTRVAEM